MSMPLQNFNCMPDQLRGRMSAHQWFAMSDERRATYMREKRKQEAYKTEMCKMFLRTGGFCHYTAIGCRFAHHEDELRLRPVHPKYKSELCRNYSIYHFCKYGRRCQFIHREQPSHRLGTSLPPMNAHMPLMLDTHMPPMPNFLVDPLELFMRMQTTTQYSQSMGPANSQLHSGRELNPVETFTQTTQYSKSGPANSLMPPEGDQPLDLTDIFSIWQPLTDSAADPSSSSS